MDIAAVIQALQTDVIDSDPTTTARAARTLAGSASATLDTVREFTDALDTLLAEAEAAAEQLADADAGDREDAHQALVDAVAELREHLLPDSVLAPAPG